MPKKPKSFERNLKVTEEQPDLIDRIHYKLMQSGVFDDDQPKVRYDLSIIESAKTEMIPGLMKWHHKTGVSSLMYMLIRKAYLEMECEKERCKNGPKD